MIKSVPCRICGELCSGNLNIEIRKGKLDPFCTFHFNRCELLTIKEIKELIKKNSGVIV